MEGDNNATLFRGRYLNRAIHQLRFKCHRVERGLEKANLFGATH